jgi:hypothetical protein
MRVIGSHAISTRPLSLSLVEVGLGMVDVIARLPAGFGTVLPT